MTKKALCIIIVFIVATSAFAGEDRGRLTISGRVSIYNPPGDADAAPMVNLQATYRMSSMISLVGSGGWSKYESGDTDITYIPIEARAQFHPLGRMTLDPHIGGGVSLNMRSYDYPAGVEGDDSDITGGLVFNGGVSYRPSSGFGVDFDLVYRIEDITEMDDSGSWSIGGGVSGNVSFDL